MILRNEIEDFVRHKAAKHPNFVGDIVEERLEHKSAMVNDDKDNHEGYLIALNCHVFTFLIWL